MPNSSMYVTVKRVNPDRLRCPVKDCEEEGKEENRVDTPFISGLGPITVYLCDTHAGELAALFLDKGLAGVVYWEKPVEEGPGEAGAITAFMGWLTTREQTSGPFSRNENPTQAAQLIRQFIDMQGWPDPPEGWHHNIKAFEDEREALGRAHLDNYRSTHDR